MEIKDIYKNWYQSEVPVPFSPKTIFKNKNEISRGNNKINLSRFGRCRRMFQVSFRHHTWCYLESHFRPTPDVVQASIFHRFGAILAPLLDRFGAAKCTAAGDIRLAFPPDVVLGVVC